MMRFAPLIVAAALLTGCAPTTELLSTWKDPAAAAIRFEKILAVCICRDDVLRRSAEDQLVLRIPRATPSYTLLSEAELRDKEAAKAKVTAAGFDGAVLMRMVNVSEKATYIPGQVYAVPSYYDNVWGGWDYGWGGVYDPGYVQVDQYVDINTAIYSLKDEKLLWASRSQTQNPSSVPSLVDEIVDANASEMRKQGVLAK
jgi:hypothetical protein